MKTAKTKMAPQPLQTFDQAERELRSIVGGDLSSRQFYGVVGLLHTLTTTRISRKR